LSSGWAEGLGALTDFGVGALIVLGVIFLAYQWLKLRGSDRPSNEYLDRFDRIASSMEEIGRGVAVLVARLEWQGQKSSEEHEGLRVGLSAALSQTQSLSRDYASSLQKHLEELTAQNDKLLDVVAPRTTARRGQTRTGQRPAAPPRRKVAELMHDAPHDPKTGKGPATA
jgi:hypothetical protein